MIFASIRIVTSDVNRLVDFYQRATGIEPRWANPVFAEFVTSAGTVAIAGVETLTFGGTPDVAEPGVNRSVFVEFRVDDVDAEFARLRDGIVDTFELEPTTLPWGNRAILFRDPDGNLVNFLAPVSDDARARQAGAVS